MLRAFCMRLCHLGLSSHLIGDVATPPISSGDLLISSAGPGSFATVDAIIRVATESGDCVVLLTARPDDVKVTADAVVHLDAQTSLKSYICFLCRAESGACVVSSVSSMKFYRVYYDLLDDSTRFDTILTMIMRPTRNLVPNLAQGIREL